jgi:hypothetical protein
VNTGHYNQYFDSRIIMTDAEYSLLVSNQKLYCTIAWLSSIEAGMELSATGYDEFEDGFYYGVIVANNIDEAILIANQRPWKEQIRGRISTSFDFTENHYKYSINYN